MGDVKARLFDMLDPIEQTHLLAGTADWKEGDFESLLREIRHLDLGLLCREQEIIRSQKVPPPPYTLLEEVSHVGHPGDRELGRRLMADGKCGCIVVAGGQASRLRLEGPKGALPLSLIKQKTLFQMLAEKVVAASQLVGRPLPIAFMTSTENRMATETFFLQNHFFGLNPRQVSFFSQPVWPLLNFGGNLVLRAPGKLAMGPNGNGDLFVQFVQNGIWRKWVDLGIEMVRVIPIDNPLALPFEEELIGIHEREKNEITMQVVKRESPQEKTGTVVVSEGKIQVIEYGEMEGKGDGFANVGLYVFSMSFVEKASRVETPIHPAQKAIRTIDDDAIPSKPNVWKLEKFIFDPFYLSDKTGVVLYPREYCFAPLKNLEGEGSMAGVQKAVLAFERVLYARVTGVTPPPDRVFELSSPFYYPTAELIERWQGKPLPETDYIEAS